MDKRNANSLSGVIGIFIAFILIIGVIGIVLQVIWYLLPFILILVFFAVFWQTIKSFTGREIDATKDENTRKSQTGYKRTTKKTTIKEPIDVEYTVIDDEKPEGKKKNDR